ncbi:G2/mitotic-specific cyclin-B3 isoform X2 [Coccinella septempunctata]|nr:G2/mitotic-specific cyclin-B3 isoform X2 [Coccinella septempunctata]XP_044750685.1 G2/mitotic-specific cyclin-B3 isoform X2 [Coccinella septempunctata]
MAPTRTVVTRDLPGANAKRTSITTRSRAALADVENKIVRTTKRKADGSPTKETKTNFKRTALSDLPRNSNVVPKKNAVEKPILKAVPRSKQVAATTIKTVTKSKNNENQIPNAPGVKTKTRLPVKATAETETVVKAKVPLKESNGKVKRLSNEFEKTEESMYSTPLEDLSVASVYKSAEGPKPKPSEPIIEEMEPENQTSNISLVAKQMKEQLNLGNHEVPEGVHDFDKENMNDVNQSSEYAMDIFNYLKEKEDRQQIPDYMGSQVCITTWMRSLLVDWMVEIQESFELNHETLYLGVKLVDLYLSRVTVGKETLQLVGAAAIFVASKYDERIPPLIEDFLYICDGAYTRRELIRMEMNLLKVCDFDLGVSISYRFLRRYARCSKVNMPVLTLARYILEISLMNYEAVTVKESKLAAASLYMALKMRGVSGWTPTLEFYTGYKIEDIISTVYLLNNDMHKTPKVQLKTIRNKYNHKIFFEVAKTPLISNEALKP